jgi:hypothetical protein
MVVRGPVGLYDCKWVTKIARNLRAINDSLQNITSVKIKKDLAQTVVAVS